MSALPCCLLRVENEETLLLRLNASACGGAELAEKREIWYWHFVAAHDWPLRMNYTPDMGEFANHQRRATQLLEQISAQPNSIAAL